MKYVDHGVQGGVWSGQLGAKTAPARICAVLRGQVVAQGDLTPEGKGQWRVQIQLPAALISDGVHSLALIADDGTAGDPPSPAAMHLARLSLVAGSPLADDLQAEIATLRDELELLKREFRHFAATV